MILIFLLRSVGAMNPFQRDANGACGSRSQNARRDLAVPGGTCNRYQDTALARRKPARNGEQGRGAYPFSGSVMLRGLSAAFSSASLTTLSLSFLFSVPALIFSMARSRTVLPDLNASLAMAAAVS